MFQYFLIKKVPPVKTGLYRPEIKIFAALTPAAGPGGLYYEIRRCFSPKIIDINCVKCVIISAVKKLRFRYENRNGKKT